MCREVHAPDADMDLLLVAPKHVSRADLFSDAPGSLLSLLRGDAAVAELLALPDAFTPVIKFKVVMWIVMPFFLFLAELTCLIFFRYFFICSCVCYRA